MVNVAFGGLSALVLAPSAIFRVITAFKGGRGSASVLDGVSSSATSNFCRRSWAVGLTAGVLVAALSTLSSAHPKGMGPRGATL